MNLQYINESLPHFEYHKTLNPILWRTDKLLSKIRTKLTDIANFYIKLLGIDTDKVDDILLVGSNANYNWTALSDIDLHIILDIPPNAIYDSLNIKELLDAKKSLINKEYNINIDGIKVEVYFQLKDEAFSNDSGKYSILSNKWLNKPPYRPVHYDETTIKRIGNKMKRSILKLINDKTATVKQYDAMKEKIKTLRISTLHENREFALNNLIFKYLRNINIIGEFYTVYRKKISDDLSLRK